jgi:hypothetical protein
MRLRVLLATVLAPLLVVALAVTGGYWASGRTADTRASLTAALDTLPAGTQLAGFTDWSRIRQRLDVGSARTKAARATLNDDASLRDLTTRSVIGRSIEEMHDSFGWSAADVDWEAYGQAASGSAMVAHLDRSVSLATVRAGLRKLGYVHQGRLWNVSTKATVSNDLRDVFGAVAILPRRRLVVASARPAYVSTVLRVIDHRDPSLLRSRRAADVASSLVGSDTALLERGVVACQATSLEDASADVKAQGRAAVERAGHLAAVEYAGRGLIDRSARHASLRFAMAFDSPGQAAEQLGVRSRLVTGPFIGREDRVEDSLILVGSDTHDGTVTMRFDHPPGTVDYMTGDGPLLFAGCGS